MRAFLPILCGCTLPPATATLIVEHDFSAQGDAIEVTIAGEGHRLARGERAAAERLQAGARGVFVPVVLAGSEVPLQVHVHSAEVWTLHASGCSVARVDPIDHTAIDQAPVRVDAGGIAADRFPLTVMLSGVADRFVEGEAPAPVQQIVLAAPGPTPWFRLWKMPACPNPGVGITVRDRDGTEVHQSYWFVVPRYEYTLGSAGGAWNMEWDPVQRRG